MRYVALLMFVIAAVLQCAPPTASAPTPPQTTASAPKPRDRQVSWKLLLPNLIHDQKPIWLLPKAVTEGQHLLPSVAVVSITGGLIALDPIDSPYFRRTSSFAAFNGDFSALNTTVAMAAFPFAFMCTDLHEKTPMRSTLCCWQGRRYWIPKF